MTAHVFVYGTLMDPRRLADVLGYYGSPPEVVADRVVGTAALVGWRRVDAKNGLPTVEPAAHCVVGGLLLKVTNKQLIDLDHYEGAPDFYTRVDVQVRVDDRSRVKSRLVDAIVYQMRDEYVR